MKYFALRLTTSTVSRLCQMNAANLNALRRKFEADLGKMEDEYQERLMKLETDLELRRKVEIHEIEERKNLHINQLMRSHEEAFEKMRAYYNDVTRGNIEVIKSLKAEVAQRQKKKEENSKLMQSVAEENQRLIRPLKVATEKVESLRADLRDADKHRMSLRNSKARVLVGVTLQQGMNFAAFTPALALTQALEQELLDLAKEHKRLRGRFEELQKEKDELYTNFEATVRSLLLTILWARGSPDSLQVKAVQRRSEFKNLVLESKLSQYEQAFDRKEAQLHEVRASSLVL